MAIVQKIPVTTNRFTTEIVSTEEIEQFRRHQRSVTTPNVCEPDKLQLAKVTKCYPERSTSLGKSSPNFFASQQAKFSSCHVGVPDAIINLDDALLTKPRSFKTHKRSESAPADLELLINKKFIMTHDSIEEEVAGDNLPNVLKSPIKIMPNDKNQSTNTSRQSLNLKELGESNYGSPTSLNSPYSTFSQRKKWTPSTPNYSKPNYESANNSKSSLFNENTTLNFSITSIDLLEGQPGNSIDPAENVKLQFQKSPVTSITVSTPKAKHPLKKSSKFKSMTKFLFN